MTEKNWKRSERDIAGALGGVRIPVSGRRGGCDIAHPWLAIEAKYRSMIPKWITGALSQARTAARPEQLPVAVIRQAGRRADRALVIVRLDDWCQWFGTPPEATYPAPIEKELP